MSDDGTIDFTIKRCQVIDNVGKQVCDCITKANTKSDVKKCFRDYINITGKEIFIFGSMCAGKSTFWKTYFSDPNFTDENGKLIDKETFNSRFKNKDEEGYRYGLKMYTTHKEAKIRGNKGYTKGGLGIYITRDLESLVDCFKQQRNHLYAAVKNIDFIKTDAKIFLEHIERLANKSKTNVILIDNDK